MIGSAPVRSSATWVTPATQSTPCRTCTSRCATRLGCRTRRIWSLQAAERRQACTIGIGPWSNHTPIGQPGPGTAYTTVTPLYGDGAWYIDSQGRVTATGDAALIEPSHGLGCLAGPSILHGTDAGGWLTG